MRRDTTSTITGWVWLDRLTMPFWSVYCRWHQRRLYRQLGDGDPNKGKALLAQAIRMAYDPVVEAELTLLRENR